jgi:hypothetical protein
VLDAGRKRGSGEAPRGLEGAVSRLVEVPLANGASVLVETDEQPRATVRGGRTADSVDTAATTLEASVDRIAPVSRAIVERMRAAVDGGPREVVVEFGLSVRAEAGLVVARAAGEANFSVRVTWQKEAEDHAG